MKVKEEIDGIVSTNASSRSLILNVFNKLNISEKTITAETQSKSGKVKKKKQIEWRGDQSAPNKESFPLRPGEVLKVSIVDGADSVFDGFGYVEFPDWVEFDFKGSTCSKEENENSRINMNRSAGKTRIWIEKGKANFALELWYQDKVGADFNTQENVNIGDDQT